MSARERFDEWYDAGPYGNCDTYIQERMWAAWQAREAECEGLREALQAIVDSAHNGNEPGQTWIMVAGGLIDAAESALSGKRENDATPK